MGQTIDQIEDQIEDRREDLRSNLEELRQKVRSAVDWRGKFRANPGAALALAFGGGFILARMSASRRVLQASAVRGGLDASRGRVSRVWDDIQSALVGVAATKVATTLADLVPGFTDHMRSAGNASPVNKDKTGIH